MQSNPPSPRARLARVARGFADAWLGRGCLLCGQPLAPHRDAFCAHCARELPGARCPRCPACAARAHAQDRPCPRCALEAPAFERTVALADYAPPIDRALLALKFAGEIALAAPLGRALARAHRRACGQALASPAGRPLVFAAVPLAPQRLAQRGFNQSAEIARAAARLAGARFDAALLARTRETPAQSLLALERRRGNLEGAFVATRRIDGGAVVVVDDVMTSGATLHACALALKAAGARVVHNLVVARTP